jgi:hypothetical protein
MASWTTTSSSRLCYSIEKFLRACCLGMKQNIGSKKILFDPKKTKNLTPAFFKSNLYPSYLFHTSSIFLCNKNIFLILQNVPLFAIQNLLYVFVPHRCMSSLLM